MTDQQRPSTPSAEDEDDTQGHISKPKLEATEDDDVAGHARKLS